jgi:hypothetical protein
MKVVHQMRNQQPWQQDKSAGPLPIFLGAAIAFGIGLLGVSGVIRVPTLLQARTQMVTVAPREVQPATIVIDPASRLLGKAENAALLKTCAPLSLLGVGDAVDHSHLYRMLQTTSSMSRVAAMTGIAQKSNDTVQIAAIWADVADCVYRQNGWMLCDPDNRALAAEAAGAFIRQLSTAEKAEQFVENRKLHPGLSGDRRIHAVQNAVAVRSRVLLGIRAQLAEGRLTAADFGMLAPSEITQIARETRVTRDACAGRN